MICTSNFDRCSWQGMGSGWDGKWEAGEWAFIIPRIHDNVYGTVIMTTALARVRWFM